MTAKLAKSLLALLLMVLLAWQGGSAEIIGNSTAQTAARKCCARGCTNCKSSTCCNASAQHSRPSAPVSSPSPSMPHWQSVVAFVAALPKFDLHPVTFPADEQTFSLSV